MIMRAVIEAVAAGFNGGGFSWAAIVGQVIAELLCDRAPGFDLKPFDPGRFARGGTAWSAANAYGNVDELGNVIPIDDAK